jgi:putative nucleotidyltransferase with HDIG domain
LKDSLVKTIPEFLLVKDEALREKCLNTWELAIKEGGWCERSILKLPFVLTELKDCPVLLVEHVRNVTQTASMIAKFFNQAYQTTEKVDEDVVIAGALLHDVGKLLEYESKDGEYAYSQRGQYVRHPAAGGILASKNGLPEMVVHIILTHSFEGDKSYQTPESYIVKTADWLNFNYLAFTYPNQMKH